MFAMAADDVECAVLDHPIKLKSTPGKGSRFSVAVPGVAVLPKSQPSHQAVIDVMVVRDKDILEGLLRNWGCGIVAAATPEAALTGVKRDQLRYELKRAERARLSAEAGRTRSPRWVGIVLGASGSRSFNKSRTRPSAWY
jgi:hypothetical protein